MKIGPSTASKHISPPSSPIDFKYPTFQPPVPSSSVALVNMFNNNQDHLKQVEQSREYYLPGGDLYLMAANVVYRVHSYFFERDSSKFRVLLSSAVPPGQSRPGSSESNPFVFDQTSPSDLNKFLWIFYNSTYSIYNAPTQDWVTILKIACEFDFKEVKRMAIRQLEECDHLSVVSRLTVYQLYKVDLVYILPLLFKLCTRDEGPTDEETEEMGVKTSLIIFRIRERLRAGADGAKSPIAAGTEDDDIIQTIYAVLGVDNRAIHGGTPLIGSVRRRPPIRVPVRVALSFPAAPTKTAGGIESIVTRRRPSLEVRASTSREAYVYEGSICDGSGAEEGEEGKREHPGPALQDYVVNEKDAWESQDSQSVGWKRMKKPEQQVVAHVNNQVITGGIHNITRNGDIRVYGGDSTEKGIDILRANVASGAHHDSGKIYEKPKCHPGTREAILKEIMNWVRDPTCSYPILWQHGPAGSGKSSIARSIAAMCKKDGLLAADFFFFRTDNNLNNCERLMATISYQIMLAIPELREAIGAAVLRDPLILSTSLESQLHTLLVQPIANQLRSESAPNARLIILDGLDECGDWRVQEDIISTFSSALANSSLPLRLMIASRPEQGIREAFRRESACPLTWEIILDDKYHPDADIKLFLNARFSDIKATHPAKRSLAGSWPSEEAVIFIVKKSSGQFIYASTVMKFVESRRCLPTDMLDIVLKLKPRPDGNSPYAELDALYTHILESVHDFAQVWQVLACIIFSKIDASSEPGMVGRQLELTPSTIESFLGFKPGQLDIALVDLHSVLHIPEDDTSGPIRLFHASLPDFLCDKVRSGKFFIDKGEAHAFLAQRCCSVLFSKSPSDPCLVEDEYLIHGFAMHCSEAVPTHELREFLSSECKFETWLELRFCHRVVHHQLGEYAGNQSSVDAFDIDVRRLFKWLRKQVPDSQLYEKFIGDFDTWLREKLTKISKLPASPYLFVSLALNNSIFDWNHLSNIINFNTSVSAITTSESDIDIIMREAPRLHGGVGNPRYEERMPGPNAPDLPIYKFFWDRGRAKEFYPQSRWFIDIATRCLEVLSEPNMPIIVMILQRIISHLPMEKEIYKLLLKYPLPVSLPKREAYTKHEPEYVKAFIDIKQFMENFYSTRAVETEQVLNELLKEMVPELRQEIMDVEQSLTAFASMVEEDIIDAQETLLEIISWVEQDMIHVEEPLAESVSEVKKNMTDVEELLAELRKDAWQKITDVEEVLVELRKAVLLSESED